MGFYIAHTAYYLPERIVDNTFLSEKCNIDKDFLDNKIGIKERHFAAEEESITDMAVAAAEKLLMENSIDRSCINFVLLCTQNPDYNLPTTACMVQDRLKLSKNCFAFDVNLGCSGYIYSLIIAGNFIKSGSTNNALVIMADQYSKIIDFTDRNTASLFGDASAASLVKKCDDNIGVLDVVYGTDGSGYDKLILPNSGIVKDAEENDHLFMNGREIFKFSMKVVPDSVNTILQRNNLKVSDIRYFVFHQANAYMLGELRKRIGIHEDQMVIDMEKYGNTVSSTIPVAYKNLLDKGMVNPGDMIVFAGFGVGLSWGVILYKQL